MKKLNDLKSERSELVEKMETIMGEIAEVISEVDVLENGEGEEVDEEAEKEAEIVEEKSQKIIASKRSQWDKLNSKVLDIDKTIEALERQEILNKNKVETMETRTTQPSVAIQFRDWLQNAIEKGEKSSFRVEPMLSTSNTDILNKEVLGIDVLKTPSEEFLRSLGVTIYTGVNGQLVLPSMAEHTASALAENVGGGDASLNVADIILAPARKSASQSVTREFLAQTNPEIYNSILANLVDSLWLKATYDLFDNVDTDGATQISTTGTTGTYANLLNLEASIGGYTSANMKYVTTPTGRAFYKGLNAGAAGIKFAWNDDNTINGYGAYAHPAANANKTYFGDFSKAVVAQWGGIEIIVDPYTSADSGKIKITALSMFDSGLWNKRAFAIVDSSIA